MQYGYRRLHVLLRREGWALGKEQAYRLYTEESLQLRSKRPRRRKMAVSRRERYVPKRPNQAWSMDLVADQLVDGTRIRLLTVVDVFTREALSIRVGKFDYATCGPSDPAHGKPCPSVPADRCAFD